MFVHPRVRGQSLIEVLISLGVGVLMLVAAIAAIVVALRVNWSP